MEEDPRIIRIEDKIDKLGSHLGSIDVTLAAQHESLRDHIRRTQLLEGTIEPLKKHVEQVSGALKFLGLVLGAISVLAAVAEILTYLRK